MKKISLLFKKKINTGIILIESSAGTGKTFTIVKLFLNFLFIKNSKNLYKYSIQKILLLTFTKNSKIELNNRIIETLKNLLQIYKKKNIKEIFKNKILTSTENINDIENHLKKIKKNIHNLEIYTVHSFFWKILQEFQFSILQDIPKNILKNIKNLLFQATKNFWRKIFYNFKKDILKILIKKWYSPLILYKSIFIKISLNQYTKSIFPIKKILNKKHKYFINTINTTKNLWILKKKKIIPLLKNFVLNKRIYTSKNIKKWHNEISQWAYTPTKNYNFPKVLKYFSNLQFKSKIFNENKMLIFKNIEKFLKIDFSLHKIFLTLATSEIFFIFQKIKIKKNYIDFNDITQIFLKNVKKKKSLLKKYIQKKYPMVLIDECQDLDIFQNKIFIQIYQNSLKNTLFLIGDPKQSIYSFRNVNLKYYFFFHKIAQEKYNLNINYRSSPKIIQSINEIFLYKKNSFFIKKLKYSFCQHSPKNSEFNFFLKNIIQEPLKFFLCSQNSITKKKYYKISAKECAASISKWILLSSKKQAMLTFQKNIQKKILPKDIVILIKNKLEAKIIKKELKKHGLSSFYTSEKKNIFLQKISLEILWILDCIIHPNNEYKFQKIFLTRFFNINIYKIHKINTNLNNKIKILKKINQYYKIWNKFGIFEMLKKIFFEYQKNSQIIQENFLIKEQEFIILIHILEKKNNLIYNKFLLIQWLQKKIQKNYELSTHQKNFSINSKKKIQIMTIFKAKGLEFPIVWIPFFSFFNNKINEFLTYKIIFQKKTFNIKYFKKNINHLLKEKFSEELRLLYVAITRSIIHCRISIATIKSKKENIYDNALKYLLKNRINKKKLYFSNILKSTPKNLVKIYQKKTKFYKIKNLNKISYIEKKKNLIKNICLPWEILSYSKILHKQKKIIKLPKKIFDTSHSFKTITKKKYTSYNFPKGKKNGILIHKILKNINFSNFSKDSYILTNTENLILTKKKKKFFSKWIFNILNCPIYSKKFSLNKIQKKQYIQEMQFFIPLQKKFNIQNFNKIIKTYDVNSKKLPDIQYPDITGMLTGAIDLIYIYNNQYFLLDYKTNWLGPKNIFYNQKNIYKEIYKNRYDVQYQIYSIALHRYLINKLKNYKYSKHFGGIIYLFIRSFDNIHNKNGIFFYLPNYSLIKKLNLLF